MKTDREYNMRERQQRETEKKERALLIGVDLHDGEDFARSMQELKSLAEACGMTAAGQVVQNLPKIHQALYMGKGKLLEVKEYLEGGRG